MKWLAWYLDKKVLKFYLCVYQETECGSDEKENANVGPKNCEPGPSRLDNANPGPLKGGAMKKSHDLSLGRRVSGRFWKSDRDRFRSVIKSRGLKTVRFYALGRFGFLCYVECPFILIWLITHKWGLEISLIKSGLIAELQTAQGAKGYTETCEGDGTDPEGRDE